MHTEAHLFSVPNDCLWYDKLWGPSQRVVTLLQYYNEGGVSRDPKFVLRNIWTAPKARTKQVFQNLASLLYCLMNF